MTAPQDGLRYKLYTQECQFYLTMRESDVVDTPTLAMERAKEIESIINSEVTSVLDRMQSKHETLTTYRGHLETVNTVIPISVIEAERNKYQ